MNTLRGVFPPPKPTYKRNFIQENMKHIKHMQGIYNKVENVKQPAKPTTDKYQNVPPKITKYMGMQPKPRLQNAEHIPPTKAKSLPNTNTALKKSKNQICVTESASNPTASSPSELNNKFRDMGVQTESVSFLLKENKNSRILKNLPSTKKEAQPDFNKNMSCGDVGNVPGENTEKLISLKVDGKPKKESNVKTAPSKTANDLGSVKAGYQRGIVPKYLRDRQKETEPVMTIDPDCPPGHITIPNDERKETLRALRQSYADLVGELNLLPVKTDTLRTRNRKIELEKQLNKIEEGIKVFSRPKVYVKINS
ncbi:uncharacterized protein LOC123300332 [Chrysoperla carnea]|uniref:uncharacterized protein LOC123300332 n=1 Tax=Chrysoperla carnea TaxID=189513 RepID=UPI001D087D0B|nr:uncharacterized protein LOC123300332 [Chrysoperla carnea]